MRGFLRQVASRIASWLEHEPCDRCMAISALLKRHGPLYGLEMIKHDQSLKRGTIYIHLARLEDRGHVERCWAQAVDHRGPHATHLKRYMYRLTDIRP